MMESGLERNEVDEYISWEIAKIKKGAYSLQAPPPPPQSRIIKEGSLPNCPVCHSSMKRVWGKITGCINPECENYYLNI